MVVIQDFHRRLWAFPHSSLLTVIRRFISFFYYNALYRSLSFQRKNAVDRRMHEKWVCEMNGKKGGTPSNQEWAQSKNETQNKKQMRNDLRWNRNKEPCRRQTIFILNGDGDGGGVYMLDVARIMFFKFYSIHPSSRQNLNDARVALEPKHIHIHTKLSPEKLSITNCWIVIWQRSSRLTKQFSTHLWKLKYTMQWIEHKWMCMPMPNGHFQSFDGRAFLRGFFVGSLDRFDRPHFDD